MQGRRIYPKEKMLFAEGDYGIQPTDGKWYACPPGCHLICLEYHDVIEHKDGTITVHPSIMISDGDWHGYLDYGVWREC